MEPINILVHWFDCFFYYNTFVCNIGNSSDKGNTLCKKRFFVLLNGNAFKNDIIVLSTIL